MEPLFSMCPGFLSFFIFLTPDLQDYQDLFFRMFKAQNFLYLTVRLLPGIHLIIHSKYSREAELLLHDEHCFPGFVRMFKAAHFTQNQHSKK